MKSSSFKSSGLVQITVHSRSMKTNAFYNDLIYVLLFAKKKFGISEKGIGWFLSDIRCVSILLVHVYQYKNKFGNLQLQHILHELGKNVARYL